MIVKTLQILLNIHDKTHFCHNFIYFKEVQGEFYIMYVSAPDQWGTFSDTRVFEVSSPVYFPSLIQQVKKFTSCLFAVKKIKSYFRGPPEYMVVMRD